MSAAPQLHRLADHIGKAVALPGPSMAQEIKAALRDATAVPDWLPPERRRASHENYARHLLYGDPGGQFSILAIVWDHGQMSPIHGHYCWCAVGVYQGELTERYYREDPAGGLLVSSALRGAGTLSFHRNANESGAVAVSLHVYGIAKDSISTGVNRIYA